jgi:hypothetical protein
MYNCIHVKYLFFLSDFNKTRIFPTDFQIMLNFETPRKSVQWEPRFPMRTDGQTCQSFRNFLNAPNITFILHGYIIEVNCNMNISRQIFQCLRHYNRLDKEKRPLHVQFHTVNVCPRMRTRKLVRCRNLSTVWSVVTYVYCFITPNKYSASYIVNYVRDTYRVRNSVLLPSILTSSFFTLLSTKGC